MSVYNGERFLREAVESILSQTLSDLELIVVDDGSDDSSPEILVWFASRDSRVVIRRQDNQGTAAALNHGFELVRAPFVARLDADDAATPTRLERQQRFLEEHAEVALLGGSVTFIDEESRSFADVPYPLDDLEIRRVFAAGTTPLANSAVMVRRSAFLEAGGYRPLFRQAEDVDLWLRIGERHRFANLPEVLALYRIHPGQKTRNFEQMTAESLAARLSADARGEGRADPVEALERIDADALLALGVEPEEITNALVRAAVWLAKTTGRAGYAEAERRLFAEAKERARSPSGSSALVAEVGRARTERYWERDLRFRAWLEAAKTALFQASSNAEKARSALRIGGLVAFRGAKDLARPSIKSALWATLVPMLRSRARRRLPQLESGGVTVVTVNWNSAPYLQVLLRLVRRHSPPRTQIIVVDNASRDGSRVLLAGEREVKAVRLPLNVGHDLALDIGFLRVETEYVVALDVDAFPLHENWLEQLIAPLRTGSEIAGAHLNREYVHPCCLAMRTERFVRRRHSFRAHYQGREGGRDASGDLGEEMSAREQGKLHFFDPTSQRGPGDVGTVFGDLVYHNFYATRFQATTSPILDTRVRRDDPAAAWAEALARYDA